MSKDLRQFLQVAKEAGPQFYAEVQRPLKPEYEVGILQQKLAREGRFPVVYCPEIKGSKLPLATNLYGSYELLGMALDVTPQRLKTEGKSAVFQEYVKRQNNLRATKEIPASEAPIRQVVLEGKEADLTLLPITLHGELDSGKYVTAGMTVSRDPDTGIPNVGIYRQELKGRDRLGCALAPGHHGLQLLQRYAELGKPMEVVTVIGHHPAAAMGAVAVGTAEMNELEVMGAFLGEPLEVTPALTVDLPVPARAEIAIEGIIDPSQMDTDGPFGEFLGYYGEKRPCYVIQVKAITMRQDAIYQDLFSAHQEHNLVNMIGHEADVYERVRSVVPTIKAVHYGPEGQCGKSFMYISISKRRQGEGRLAGLAALSSRRYFKVAVVVDDDVDVYDEQEVLWAIGTRVRWDQDTCTVPGLPSMHTNPCAHGETGVNRGSLDAKIMIDATRPLGSSFAERVTPPKQLWDAMKLEDYLK